MILLYFDPVVNMYFMNPVTGCVQSASPVSFKLFLVNSMCMTVSEIP